MSDDRPSLLAVHEPEPQDERNWDAFVMHHPHGTPFHLHAWRRSVERVFRYQPRYLMATENGEVAGVLPLFLVENFLMGRVLISSPFAVYGGILASSNEARTALFERARALAAGLGVEHLELRNGFSEQCVGLPVLDRYVTFVQEVSRQDTGDLLASLPKKTRNIAKKTLKHGYTSRKASDLKAFHRLMALNYRRHGTPYFPKLWFQTLLENFGAMADVREILLDGQAAAVSMNFLFRDQMHTYYAASDQDRLDRSPNNFLYLDHLLWAGANGFRTFDFGRSKTGTGTFEFKKHWSTTMRELPYEVLLVKRKELPNFSPKNPKFQLAMRAWQLMPVAITRWLGPHFIKLFP